MFHYVYVMQNENMEIRAGYALDLPRRLEEHKKELTEDNEPWHVVYCEAYLHLSDAMRRAQYLKSLQGTKLIKQRLQRYLSK